MKDKRPCWRWLMSRCLFSVLKRTNKMNSESNLNHLMQLYRFKKAKGIYQKPTYMTHRIDFYREETHKKKNKYGNKEQERLGILPKEPEAPDKPRKTRQETKIPLCRPVPGRLWHQVREHQIQ